MQLKFLLVIISSLFLVKCHSRLPKYSIYRTVKEGASIVLSCTFDSPVECSWRCNGSYVSSDGLYTYLTQNEFSQNSICTIEISSFNSTAHGGYWNCAELNAPLSQTRVSYHLNKPYVIREFIAINAHDKYLWLTIGIFSFAAFMFMVTLAVSIYFKVTNEQEEQKLQERLNGETTDQELTAMSENLIYE